MKAIYVKLARLLIIVVVIVVVVLVGILMIPSYAGSAAKRVQSFVPRVNFQKMSCMFYCFSNASPEEVHVMNASLYNLSTTLELPTYFSCNYQLLELAALAWEYGRWKVAPLEVKTANFYCLDNLLFFNLSSVAGALVVDEVVHHCDDDFLSNVDSGWFVSEESDSINRGNNDFSTYWLWRLVSVTSPSNSGKTIEEILDNQSWDWPTDDEGVPVESVENYPDWVSGVDYQTSFHNITLAAPDRVLQSRARFVSDTVNLEFEIFPGISTHITGSKEGGVMSVTELGAFGNATQFLFNCFAYGLCDSTSEGWCQTTFFGPYGCGYTFRDFCKVDPWLSTLPYINCFDQRTLNDRFNPKNAFYDYNRHESLRDVENEFVCKYNPPYDACNVELEKYANETQGCQPAWLTLLNRQGVCEDFAILYYTAFRTLGVPYKDLTLEFGACELPCPCKQLVDNCTALSYEEVECFAPAKLTVKDFGEIDVCGDPMDKWTWTSSGSAGFEVINVPGSCVDNSCLKLYDGGSGSLELTTPLLQGVPCYSAASFYCKPTSSAADQCIVELLDDNSNLITRVKYSSGSWQADHWDGASIVAEEVVPAGASAAGEWHSVSIVHNCSNGVFNVFIDGASSNPLGSIIAGSNSPSRFKFKTDDSSQYYIDKVMVFDPSYTNDFVAAAETGPLIQDVPVRLGGKFIIYGSGGYSWTAYQNYTGQSNYAKYYYVKSFDDLFNDYYNSSILDSNNNILFIQTDVPDNTCQLNGPCGCFPELSEDAKVEYGYDLVTSCAAFIDDPEGTFINFVNTSCDGV